MSDDDIGRRATALESGLAEADPAEREMLERLRLMLAHPATWTEPSGPATPPVPAPEPGAAPGRPEEAARPGTPPAVAGRPPRHRFWHRPFRRPLWVVIPVGLVAAALAAWFAISPGLLTGSAPVRVDLAGTGPAQGASASAVATDTGSGWHVIVDITGLPPAPEGTYYEGWVATDGLHVPLGTFHARGGDDEVQLWAGVPIRDFDRIVITMQRTGAGNDPGDPVLSGPIP